MRRIAASFVLACLSLSIARAGDKAEPRAPIEDTYIIAPRHSAEYTLTRTVNYADTGDLVDGVGLTYRDALSPALNTDIYIYPAGDNATPEALESGFRASVKAAEARGIYTITRQDGSTPYVLRQHDGSEWQGRMVSLRMKLERGEFESRAYLFHHGVYAYKVRIDLPVAQAANLPTTADALVRALLPSIQVVSIGSCGKQMTIEVLKGADVVPAGYVDGVSADGFGLAIRETDLNAASAGSTAAAPESNPVVKLTRLAAQRQVAHGCTSFPFEPHGDDVAVLKLHYPAGFWRSGPADPRH
ncbi:hypothetical protein QMK61_11090 [Fulvimonas sp. R45]|uniref:hypothetical protein n=1 Tax=Fulvimonas sp. R45 TaxID=3045937 RepID=UPI00265DDFAA|nr:hypothetical protein [Fulvimonas sp. R45]MDO1529373.1 hypothetical protein [Fulvimonas sp. R45]